VYTKYKYDKYKIIILAALHYTSNLSFKSHLSRSVKAHFSILKKYLNYIICSQWQMRNS